MIERADRKTNNVSSQRRSLCKTDGAGRNLSLLPQHLTKARFVIVLMRYEAIPVAFRPFIRAITVKLTDTMSVNRTSYFHIPTHEKYLNVG